ncbi:MAG TPA: cytochrome c-type biogenesis protein CcmH [Gemmatimonadales bacterium]|nr:cytochrome c-type biogenesis protein CcmH [Gemmatimonadales bacterium]
MLRGLSALLVALLAASAGPAQEPRAPDAGAAPDTMAQAQNVTQANQLLGTIMSPFCPGLTLATCPSPNAETLRVSIRGRLAAGEPPDAIMESLVLVYGEGVRGAPKPRGLGLLLWALPVVALGAAGAGLLWWLRTRTGAPVVAPDARGGAAPSAATANELARLEAEQRLLE